MIPLTCGIKKKMTKMNLFAKQKQTHRQRKQIHVYQPGASGAMETNSCLPKGNGEGRDKLGIGD